MTQTPKKCVKTYKRQNEDEQKSKLDAHQRFTRGDTMQKMYDHRPYTAMMPRQVNVNHRSSL